MNVLLKYSYKWQKIFSDKIDDVLLTNIANAGWKITNVSKLQSFHHKIITGTLTTNIQLYYYKIKDSKKCTFCNDGNETLLHLFVHCTEIQELFNYIM